MLKAVSKRWVAELAIDDPVTRGHEGCSVWGGGCAPSPENFVNFAPGDGAFWCTFYAIFLESTGIIIIQNTVLRFTVRR